MKSGIYTITNIIDGKLYVGYAKDLDGRRGEHFSCLRNNYHGNTHLQNAYNKYGENCFIFEIVDEYVNNTNILASAENYWAIMLQAHSREFGYNIAPTGHDGKNTVSEETRLRMSKAKKGIKRSPEASAKTGAALKGRKKSAEHCKKMSETMMGRVPWNKGMKYSEEVCKRFSESQKNSKIPKKPWSEESKEKLRISKMGNIISLEAREKIRQSKLGKKRTPESIEKGKQTVLNKRLNLLKNEQ